jgi:hypothetical protein
MSKLLPASDRSPLGATSDVSRRPAGHHVSGFQHRSNPVKPGTPRGPGSTFAIAPPSVGDLALARRAAAHFKQEVTEVANFLKYPDKYRRAGTAQPRGVLTVGPPGRGKRPPKASGDRTTTPAGRAGDHSTWWAA